jgi:peptidoglycan DL-endopeptidase CwlO
MRRRILALLLVAACSGAGAAAVAGAHSERPVVARIPAIPVAKTPANVCPVPTRFRAAFVDAANDTGLPLALLTAVAQVESRFQPRATSSAGAQGLLQLMPTTAAELKLDAQDPTSNVLAGARYLERLLARFHSTDLALAAYNAGPTAVARDGGAPNSETLTYVENVTDTWRILYGCS